MAMLSMILPNRHVVSPAQERAPQSAAIPESPQIARATPHEPTADNLETCKRKGWETHMKFAVMKIPDPITVPITNDVAPTEE